MSSRAALLTTVASVLLAGCECAPTPGGDAGMLDAQLEDAGGAGDLPLDRLCGVLVDDICRALIECYGAEYRDLDHCRADQICGRYSDLEMEIASGWATYDAAAAAACDARFRADPCAFGFFIFVPTVHQVLARCPGVVTGQQSAGEDCASDLDCVGGTFCSMAGSTCPGTCATFVTEGGACTVDGTADCDPALVCRRGACGRHLAAGDACDASTVNDCYAEDLWCDVAAGMCREGVGDGAPCDDLGGARCADGLVCVQSFPGEGTCRAPGASGETCDQDRDCQDGLSCYQPASPALGTCRARAGSGGACASSTDCSEGLRCVSSACAPRAAMGEPCTTGFGAEPCAEGLTCDAGTCRDARYPGEPCDDGTGACVLSICRAGTCAPRAPLGASCTAAGDCASDACATVCVDDRACL